MRAMPPLGFQKKMTCPWWRDSGTAGQPQAAGLQFTGDAHAGDVLFHRQAVEGFVDLDARHALQMAVGQDGALAAIPPILFRIRCIATR